MTSKKTALVTGGNKGIGYAIASQLAAKGYTVWIGSRDAERGRAAAARLSDKGDVRTLTVDLTDVAGIAAAAKLLASETPHLDALVNNAGISLSGAGKASTADLGVMEEIFETNVFGSLRVTQAFLPLLQAAPAARIVMVSSGLASLTRQADPADSLSNFETMAYSASKSALNALTLAFANELRGTTIKVNAVNPGYVATDINNNSGSRTPEQGAQKAVELATLGDDGPTGGFFNDAGVEPW